MTDKQLAILLDYIIKDIKHAKNNILDDFGLHKNKKISLDSVGASINNHLMRIIKSAEAYRDQLLDTDFAVPYVPGARGFTGPFDGLEKLLEMYPDRDWRDMFAQQKEE